MSQPQQQTRKAEVLTTRALVEPSSVNAEARTVDVVWSTGAEVARRDWFTGERYAEVLSMDPRHVRLERLNSSGPVLDSHNASSTRSVLASVVPGSARTDGKQGTATIKFSRRPEAEAVFQDIRDSVLRSLSVGYVVHKHNVEKATSKKIERRTAVDWEPYEISIVPIPADAGAQVRASDELPPSEAQATRKDNTMALPNTNTNEAVTTERARIAAIDELCRVHGVDVSPRPTAPRRSKLVSSTPAA